MYDYTEYKAFVKDRLDVTNETNIELRKRLIEEAHETYTDINHNDQIDDLLLELGDVMWFVTALAIRTFDQVVNIEFGLEDLHEDVSGLEVFNDKNIDEIFEIDTLMFMHGMLAFLPEFDQDIMRKINDPDESVEADEVDKINNASQGMLSYFQAFIRCMEAIANKMDYTLADVLERNVLKLEERYELE